MHEDLSYNGGSLQCSNFLHPLAERLHQVEAIEKNKTEKQLSQNPVWENEAKRG